MATEFEKSFAEFVRDDAFPCVGAKSVLARANMTFFEGAEINRAVDDFPLYQALKSFGETLQENPGELRSFVAGFTGPRDLSEAEFEQTLWDRLQALHNMDAAAGEEWTDDISPDAGSPHFSMSVAGHAFFVVGLHPGASRKGRRFSRPVLVFNSHEQFEQLREDGRYGKIQSVIRKRDRELNGNVNPMVEDFGRASEARQYSGRQVPDDWQCPIKVRSPQA